MYRLVKDNYVSLTKTNSNIIILIIVAVIGICIFYKVLKGFNGTVENFERDDLLLTDYYKRFTCSKTLDNLPKHMRIHHSGNPMYTSNMEPTPEEKCSITNCPPLVKDDITPNRLDHYNPYNPAYQDPKPNSNLTCWSCQN